MIDEPYQRFSLVGRQLQTRPQHAGRTVRWLQSVAGPQLCRYRVKEVRDRELMDLPVAQNLAISDQLRIICLR